MTFIFSGFISVIGNATVIFNYARHMQSTFQFRNSLEFKNRFMVTNLAVADLLFGVRSIFMLLNDLDLLFFKSCQFCFFNGVNLNATTTFLDRDVRPILLMSQILSLNIFVEPQCDNNNLLLSLKTKNLTYPR